MAKRINWNKLRYKIDEALKSYDIDVFLYDSIYEFKSLGNDLISVIREETEQ